jgi:crossover junction endodeoxyribonuclease RuvC
MPYVEYAPRRIKQAITGNGAAAKEQVAGMLKSILSLKEIPSDMDASDGLAAAVCHHYNSRFTGGGKKYSTWSSFVNQNPSRTKS